MKTPAIVKLGKKKKKPILGKGENLISRALELPHDKTQMSIFHQKTHKTYKESDKYGLYLGTKINQ